MKWLVILAAMFVGLMVAYSIFYPTTTYKFRITLNVDTPQGLKSGSSVMEVRHRRYPAWMTLGANTGESELKGEAVFVDLGSSSGTKARNLLALLLLGPRGEIPDLQSLPGMTFRPFLKPSLAVDEGIQLSRLAPGIKTDLFGETMPVLVSFADIADPRTARVVRPDNLAQTFGGGFSLRNATIEIVAKNEPLLRGLASRLPWWNGPGRPTSVALRAAGLALYVSELAFIRD